MPAWLQAILAVAAVSLVSLVGALAFVRPELRGHRVLLVLVAMAAGTLVGDAFFHLVPEAAHGWEEAGLDRMGLVIVGGFVAFFLLEVLLRARHAHLEQALPDAHGHAHDGHAQAVAPFAWTNLVGDAIHNLVDGAVIATAFLADAALGWATTVAVAVHEIPQELGDFAVLLRAGLSPAKALLLNLASAGVAMLGAGAVLLLPVPPEALERFGLPFIAGAFLYIAAADLVPELHHHSKGKEAGTILVSFLAGLAIMWALLAFEPGAGHA